MNSYEIENNMSSRRKAKDIEIEWLRSRVEFLEQQVSLLLQGRKNSGEV